MSRMRLKALFVLLLAVAARGFGQQQAAELNDRLLKAVGGGNAQAARDCLSGGAAPNAMDAQGQTALYLAAQIGSVELVDLLLSKGADPNLPNRNNVANPEISMMVNPEPAIVSPSGTTLIGPTSTNKLYSDEELAHGYSALMIAAKNGSLEIVSLLLRKGANPNYHGFFIPNEPLTVLKVMEGITPSEKNTALSLAAAGGAKTRAIAELLLRSGADADEGNKGIGSTTLLMTASEAGDYELAKLLLKHGANINAKDWKKDSTPLSLAVQNHRWEIVKLFQQHGAVIGEFDQFQMALAAGDVGALDLLLQKGADLKARDYLRLTAERGDVRFAEALLKHGAEVDSGNSGLGAPTPLMIASRAGNTEVARLLLERGANANAQSSEDNSTSLTLAIQNRHGEITKLLLQHGAEIRSQNHLRLAAEQGDVLSAEALLQHGADVEAGGAGAGTLTPLMIASKAGNAELAKLLLEHGAEVNARSEEVGYTPLLLAVSGRHLQVAELLLDHGAKANARSKDKQTPGRIAVDNGDKAMIRMLSKHGARIPDRFKWLFFDASVAPITTMADGQYFEGLENGYGAGVKARVYFGGIVGLLTGVSYELSQNAYLDSAYQIGYRNFSLDIGVFARLRSNFLQGYALMASTGTSFANGPASGKLSEEADAGGALSLEGGVRVRIMRGLGAALFVKKASYAYYPGPGVEEDGELLTAGLGVSYQF